MTEQERTDDGLVLFTDEVNKALKKYPYRSQDGKGKDAKVICRIFGGCYTAYILEADEREDDILYGIASFGYGFEYGTIYKPSLEASSFLERDTSVIPEQKTLGECMKLYNEKFM